MYAAPEQLQGKCDPKVLSFFLLINNKFYRYYKAIFLLPE